MSGTGCKCLKCGKIFRIIHGISTEKLHELLMEDEKNRFFGEEFMCCGEVSTLYKLGMKDEMLELQGEWLKIMAKIYEKNPLLLDKIQSVGVVNNVAS